MKLKRNLESDIQNRKERTNTNRKWRLERGQNRRYTKRI